jgi:serine phosphatase RsbU (regulator of sigma subunit)
MRKLLSFCFLLFIVTGTSAQEGVPLLTHFRNSREIEDQSWAICQDRNKVMLFANRKGILAFDGKDWQPVRMPLTPLSMRMNPYDKRVYVGGENNYGFIEQDRKGLYNYESLSGDSAVIGTIRNIVFLDSLVFFQGESSISCYDVSKRLLLGRHFPKTGSSFTGIIVIDQKAYVNIEGQGISEIVNESLVPLQNGSLTRNSEIMFSLPYDDKSVLIGMNGKLSLFDGVKCYDYTLQDSKYLSDNILSDGISVGDSLYAFSTLEGGALIVNKKSGKTRYMINNQKGLPDDEIFAIGYDASGGLWLSHPLGLTRADLSLPLENFSIYTGLKGNLSASLMSNNELYVATSEGVYCLVNQRSYSEIEVIRKNEASVGSISIPEPVLSQSASLVPLQNQPSKKGLLSRIFGGKDKNTAKNVTTAVARKTEPVTVKPVPSAEFTIKKIRKLKSVDYVFKKISGLDDKCRQLVSTPHGILAATNKGLYIIKNHQASEIVPDRYIHFITWNPDQETYYVGASDGYFLVKYERGRWSASIPDKNFVNPVYSILRSGKTTWLGSDNVAYRSDLKEDGSIEYHQFTLNNSFPQRYLLNLINDTVFLLTESGMSYYDEKSGNFNLYDLARYSGFNENAFRYPLSNIPLLGNGNEWICPAKSNQPGMKELAIIRLFDDVVSVNFDRENIWIIDGENQLFCIDRKKPARITPCTDLMVKNVKNEKGISFDLSDIVFERGDNVINFEIIAPSFLKKNLTQYQYFIDGVMTEWSPWSSQSSYSRGIPEAGSYTLQVRARDFWGETGEPISLSFTMKAPFTKTTFFYLLIASATLVIVILVVRFRESQLHDKNRLLEQKVRERTAEIAAQKEEITSSIEYASRIQMAMLPVSDLFMESFSEYFIFFRPRDIVSGDFYWIGEDEKNIFLTVADCTGHGVPGAFMSTLGISALNEIITNNQDLKANTVLNQLRDKIKTSLHQTGKEGEAADGMDISFCAVKKNRKILQYAGAFNPLYYCTNSDLIELKADRMPIGIHYGDEASFTNHEIPVRKGDVVYLMSDGISDQFGGTEGTKYKKAQLKKLLWEIHHRPMAEQKRLIENEFLRWKGHHDQVDDITVVGVRI